MERKFIKPYKAVSCTNEGFEPSALYEQLVPGRWYLEPKIDGIAVWVEKTKDEVRLFSADKLELTEKLPELTTFLKQWDGTFTAVGELVAVDKESNFLPHEDMVAIAHRKCVHTIPNVNLILYDILENNGLDLRDYALATRRTFLEELFPISIRETYLNPPVGRIYHTIFDTTEDSSQLFSFLIRNLTSKEGVVIKHEGSHYDHEGSKLWWKLKWHHELDLEVVHKRQVKGSYCTYNYEVAYLDGYAEDGSRVLQKCGKTMNSNVQADIGDILSLRVERVMPFKDGTYGIYIARVVEKREDKDLPDPVSLLRTRSGRDLCHTGSTVTA